MPKSNIEILDYRCYKERFLPHIDQQVHNNEAKIQLYPLQEYMRGIISPERPYRTSFNFMLVLTKGELSQYLDGHHYHLKAGEILTIKHGNITQTLSFSSECQGYFVLFEKEIVTDISLCNSSVNIFNIHAHQILGDQQINWVMRTLNLLEQETKGKRVDMEICISLLHTIFIKISRLSEQDSPRLNRPHYIASQFRDLVQQCHIDHKDVPYYAQRLHVSENYLNKCVKEATNEPPKQWINEISILHGQMMLQDACRDIAGIAFELNYTSPSHFTRLFKKVTGYSPREYRKLHFTL